RELELPRDRIAREGVAGCGITVVHGRGPQEETAMRADGTCEREPGMPVTVFADLAVQHGFRLARTGAGDDVDDAAQRVRSVDRGLRAAHDLDPLDVSRIEDREIEGS